MLHILEMKQMGFVLAAAVLLDAFVIRVMILPSALLLLGRAAWWPSRAVRRAEERAAQGRTERFTGADGGGGWAAIHPTAYDPLRVQTDRRAQTDPHRARTAQ